MQLAWAPVRMRLPQDEDPPFHPPQRLAQTDAKLTQLITQSRQTPAAKWT